MLTSVWASVWSSVHQQLQALVRTIEEHFLLPQREKGTQRHYQELKECGGSSS
uniref:MMT1 n=1 Tax=Arundo donax TaxID=35708 RepID=A0A0A9CSJ0_ARUDO